MGIKHLLVCLLMLTATAAAAQEVTDRLEGLGRTPDGPALTDVAAGGAGWANAYTLPRHVTVRDGRLVIIWSALPTGEARR